jgi:hypothetical protein
MKNCFDSFYICCERALREALCSTTRLQQTVLVASLPRILISLANPEPEKIISTFVIIYKADQRRFWFGFLLSKPIKSKYLLAGWWQ